MKAEGKELPPYLRSIRTVVVDAAVAGSAMAGRVRGLLPQADFSVLKEGEILDRMDQKGPALVYLKHYRGRFLKRCPGTSRYRCCGYRIVHIGENCPLSCSYCILQAYFQDSTLKVWANQGDLYRELESEFAAYPEKRYRVGTGEFADSLALEALTGVSHGLVEMLAGHPNVCLELKSKVVDLSWIEAVKRPDRVLPAWSLNSIQVHASQERGTATLEQRLAAARHCAELGFRICLHFDPIIHHPGWEQGYARTVEMIFDHLRPRDIAYLSLGSFRCMPRLKDVISRNHPGADYIHDEFITGLDGKLRLLRPLRVRQLRFVADRLRRGGLDRELYLCMESDQVWKAVLGRTPRGGLSRLLMDRAFPGER